MHIRTITIHVGGGFASISFYDPENTRISPKSILVISKVAPVLDGESTKVNSALTYTIFLKPAGTHNVFLRTICLPEPEKAHIIQEPRNSVVPQTAK